MGNLPSMNNYIFGQLKRKKINYFTDNCMENNEYLSGGDTKY